MKLFGRKNSSTNDEKGKSASPGPASVGGNTVVFRVTIPHHVRPGEAFQVNTGSRIVRVRGPPDSRPGQSLHFTVPKYPNPIRNCINGHLLPDSPNVSPIPDSDPPAFMVTVPEGVMSGQQFPVTINGQQRFLVTCPLNARPGFLVRIVPPAPRSVVPRRPRANAPKKKKETKLFLAEVPKGVQPGAPFALPATLPPRGVRVLIMCPPNSGPGKKIRFELPLALIQKHKIANELAQIKLNYDKEGWTRAVRATDLKFQWIRMDDNGDIDLNKRFNFQKSAYVRKLDFLPGKDPQHRACVLSLVPANEAVVDSKIKSETDGRELVTYSDLAQAQVKKFDDKAQWFLDTCAHLCVEWNAGHMRIKVPRQFSLGDSVDAVMSMSPKDLRKLWRFEYIDGSYPGRLLQEWFEMVYKAIFDPDMGLWLSSTTNQMSMNINPDSQFCCDDHLVYYRFLGRVMGKAMLDRQLVRGHMTKYIYKHMLGWPIQFKDLESVDEECYRSLKQLQAMAENGDDMGMMGLNFTITVKSDILGSKEVVELVDDGKNIEVTNDNFPEYVEACLQYKLMGCVKPQLNELLLGFFDVIPEPLLTVFDFQELELLMCGLPEINMEDWMTHTEYSGEYEDVDELHPTCQWFWEVVSEFDWEMKARLLQFVTGTSGVPSEGFGVLQGNDGNIRKFTIHGVPVRMCFYPRAHTCFNRIDLPMYSCKNDLRDKLKFVVTMSSTGFDIE